MQLEFQYIFNLGIMIVGGVAMYLFGRTQDHEKRIQKVEDVQGTKLDRLTNDFENFQVEMRAQLKTISDNIHKKNNTENTTDKTLKALLNYLERNETD